MPSQKLGHHRSGARDNNQLIVSRAGTALGLVPDLGVAPFLSRQSADHSIHVMCKGVLVGETKACNAITTRTHLKQKYCNKMHSLPHSPYMYIIFTGSVETPVNIFT